MMGSGRLHRSLPCMVPIFPCSFPGIGRYLLGHDSAAFARLLQAKLVFLGKILVSPIASCLISDIMQIQLA